MGTSSSNVKLKSRIKEILFTLGLPRHFSEAFGVKKTALTLLHPFLVNNNKAFFSNLPPSCQGFLATVGLKENDKVLDIGANQGETVSYFHGQGCEVFAFEPNPVCAEFLKKRFAKSRRVHIYQEAIGKSTGEVSFFVTPDSSLSSSLIDRSEKFKTIKIESKSRRIGEVLREHGPFRLIKIDVEGGEYEILDELLKPENLEKFDYCAVETHAHKIPSLLYQHSKLMNAIAAHNLKARVFLGWH